MSEGSGATSSRPESELDDVFGRASLRTRLKDGGRRAGKRVRGMSSGQQTAAVTLIVSAGLAVWRGPRVVASLRGRKVTVGDRLRSWRS